MVVEEDEETHREDHNDKEDQNWAGKEELINPAKAKENVDLVEGEIGKITNIFLQKDLEHGSHNERVSPEKYTNFQAEEKSKYTPKQQTEQDSLRNTQN